MPAVGDIAGVDAERFVLGETLVRATLAIHQPLELASSRWISAFELVQDRKVLPGHPGEPMSTHRLSLSYGVSSARSFKGAG